MRPSTPPAASSAIRSEAVSPNVVVTWFSGYITKELAEQRLLEFRGLIAGCIEPVWIMELTAMTGFDPRAIGAGAEWWRYFKSKHAGKTEILFISTQSAARMAGATLSFSTGVSVRSFGSLDECFEALGVILPVRRSLHG